MLAVRSSSFAVIGEVARDDEVPGPGAGVQHDVVGVVVGECLGEAVEPEHAHAVGAEVGHEQPAACRVDDRLVRVRRLLA